MRDEKGAFEKKQPNRFSSNLLGFKELAVKNETSMVREERCAVRKRNNLTGYRPLARFRK